MSRLFPTPVEPFKDLQSAEAAVALAVAALRRAAENLPDKTYRLPVVEYAARLSQIQDDLYALGVSLGSATTEGSNTDA